MAAADSGSGSFLEGAMAQARLGMDYLPSLVAGLAVLAGGWLVARLVRGAVPRLALASNHLLDRTFPRGVLAGARVSALAATLIGEVIYWVILLVSVTVAARMAGLSALSVWLDRLTENLPSFIAGVTIVVVGYFLSVYVREQIAPLSSPARRRRSLWLGRVAQSFVIATALIVGLDQVGIDVALLVALVIVAFAAPLVALAVSFGLGARRYAGNLIGARTARSQLSVGLRVRIGEVEGEVLEITPTQIALNSDAGKVLVPAGFMDSQLITILAPAPEQVSPDV